jgi:hypothetical protein
VISFNLPVSGNTPVWIGGAKKTTTGNVADSKTVGLTIGNAYDLNVNRFWGDIYRFRIFLGGLSDAQLASTPLWLDAPPRGPDLAPITASTTTSLVASWTHLTGVSSYRLDVATDPAMLTGYLPGYQSRIVATSSAGGLTIDATGYTGQTVYLRMRSAGAGGIGPSTATTAAVIP